MNIRDLFSSLLLVIAILGRSQVITADPTIQQLLDQVGMKPKGEQRGQADIVGFATTAVQMEEVLKQCREFAESRKIELQNQFDRFGGTNKKVGIVSSLSHKLGETTIRVEDLGNIFNRTGTITPNGASDFSTASSTDKLFNAYITDDNGVTDNDEETIGTMLIQ